MNEGTNQPLVLRKKSRSSRFASWSGNANHFYDKVLRAFYIFLLFTLDFVMFVYSINGKLLENGEPNQAIAAICGGVFVAALLLMLILSFSKDVQNVVCAVVTLLITVAFFNQFALFDVNTFIEKWLEEKASWLTFIGIIPSTWLVGLLLGVIVFFAFRSTFAMLFVTMVLAVAGGIGIKNNEFITQPKNEYNEVRALPQSAGKDRNGNLVYLMLPKFPSYQFLNTVRDHNFRELRDLMIGFYAINDFEIYPNAFVKKNDTMSNVIDIFNQVDYTSTTSGNRGYSEFINEWDFIHGGLDYLSLEENRLYEYLRENGYGLSTYAMPGFNLCITGNNFNTDRCVVKSYKTISLYDKSKSLEQNIYALLAEWVLSMKNRDLNSVAKTLASMSSIKGYKVTAENRRISQEGAIDLLNVAAKDFLKDKGGQVYMVYVDLPSDIYMYDEFCNLKPRKEWVALNDNSLARGGIDEKRKAYADQAKCAIGKLQEYMDAIKASPKNNKTDVIVQGVSNIRELADMSGGRYANFVKDQLVSLGIRKGKRPRFLINANVCLASDFTKTLIRYQDYCYTIDNMKMQEEEAINLKQNLINNAVLRGSKISNIAANYRDWYEIYKQKSQSYQAKAAEVAARPKPAIPEKAAQPVLQESNKVFAPTDKLIMELDDNGELRSYGDVSVVDKAGNAPQIPAQGNLPPQAVSGQAVPAIVQNAVPAAEIPAEQAVEVPTIKVPAGQAGAIPAADIASGQAGAIPAVQNVQPTAEVPAAAVVPAENVVPVENTAAGNVAPSEVVVPAVSMENVVPVGNAPAANTAE